MQHQVEIDYHRLNVERGDTFLAMTDGVDEHVALPFVRQCCENAGDLDLAARAIVDAALANGSGDNLTIRSCASRTFRAARPKT